MGSRRRDVANNADARKPLGVAPRGRSLVRRRHEDWAEPEGNLRREGPLPRDQEAAGGHAARGAVMETSPVPPP
jgi:hypothetical protein